jgi:small subunit ribosomal protein S8
MHDMPRVLGGAGTVVVSTNRGIMTGREARRRHLGGELIAEIW